MREPLRLSIIGCGIIARRHIVALKELQTRELSGITVNAVCDANVDAARGLALAIEEQLGQRPTIYSRYEDLLRAEHSETD